MEIIQGIVIFLIHVETLEIYYVVFFSTCPMYVIHIIYTNKQIIR